MDADLKKIQRMLREGEEVKKQAYRELCQLRAGIKDGSITSGDQITDFCLVICGVDTEGIEDKLRGIDAKIDAHQGEQMLIVQQSYERQGEDGCFSQSYLVPTGSFLRLGVLSGKLSFSYEPKDFDLEMMDNGLLFPTKKYARKGNPWREYEPNWVLEEGRIAVSSENLARYSQDSRVRNIHSDRSEKRYFLIGNEEVELYFRSSSWQQQNRDFENLSEADKEYLGRSQYINSDYAEALDLLGIEAPLEFRVAFDRGSDQRKVKVFYEILDLKDESKLKERLEYAVKIGLHEYNKTIQRKEPGTVTHIGQYVSARCEQLGVEMHTEKDTSGVYSW